jgi:hypothetical protein
MSVGYQQPAITDLTGTLSPELHLRSADLESIVDELRAYHARLGWAPPRNREASVVVSGAGLAPNCTCNSSSSC